MILPTFEMAPLTTRHGCTIPLRVDYSRGVIVNLYRVFHFIACCVIFKLTWKNYITYVQVGHIVFIAETNNELF